MLVGEASVDDVYSIMQKAQENDKIKYVVVEINSYGGSPVAGMEMMTAFKNFKKPVVVFARNGIASAAYLAATGAQTIFASVATDVGSIGVTASYLENVEKNRKEGLEYIDLSVGKYKDTGDPNRPISNEEKQLIMRDCEILHEQFISAVATNRNLDIDKVRELADGSTMLGEAALKNGLIDRIGDAYDVVTFLTEKMGEEVKICWQN